MGNNYFVDLWHLLPHFIFSTGKGKEKGIHRGEKFC